MAIALFAGLSIAIAHFAAGALTKEAEATATECLRALESRGEGSSAECVDRAGAWLTVPGLVPWHREEAERRARSWRLATLEAELDVATALAPDRARALRVAREYLDAGGDPSLVASRGVAEAIATTPASRFDGDDALEAANRRDVAFEALWLLGDAESMGRLAAAGGAPSDAPASTVYVLEHRRGLSSCIAGDHERGLEALRRARDASPDLEVFVSVARWACGEEPPVVASRVPLDGLAARLILHERGGGSGRAWLHDWSSFGGSSRLFVLAMAIDAADDPVPEIDELLAIVAPIGWTGLAPTHDGPTPSALTIGRSWSQLPVPAATYERAAERLEGLAETVPESIADDGSALRDEILDDARQNPRAYLRDAARLLWHDAAGARALAGEREAAIRDAARAEALASDADRGRTAPILIDAGDAEGAERILARQIASPVFATSSSDSQSIDHLNRAFALAHLGRSDEALTETVLARAKVDDPALAASVEWTRVAMALRTGTRFDPSELAGHTSGLRRPLIPDESKRALLYWSQLALEPEPPRARQRVSIERLFNTDRNALSAVMYVIGRSAGDRDAEAWLDRVFYYVAQDDPRAYAKARAEAARWRADADAERRWNEVAARFEVLNRSYDSAMLTALQNRSRNN